MKSNKIKTKPNHANNNVFINGQYILLCHQIMEQFSVLNIMYSEAPETGYKFKLCIFWTEILSNYLTFLGLSFLICKIEWWDD